LRQEGCARKVVLFEVRSNHALERRATRRDQDDNLIATPAFLDGGAAALRSAQPLGSAVKASASIDLMYTDRRPAVDVRAKVSLLASLERGRCNIWRPRHNFGAPGDRVFYIGNVDLGSSPISPGETRDVLVRFIDGPGLRDHLRPGRLWRIEEGFNLIATAEVVEIVGGT
jgi:hypothetical protein